LVQHGVQGNGGLSGLTIANDQFTLATANRHHGVDRFKASLDRLVDGSSRENTGGFELGTASLGGLNWAFAINGLTEGVNNTTKHGLANRNIDNLASPLHGFTFFDKTIGTEKHHTDLAGFQVHAHSLDARREFDQLLSLDIAHAMDTGDTVTDGQDTASLGQAGLFLHTTDSLLEDGRNFGRRGFGVGSI
jgi:hypothetical protein